MNDRQSASLTFFTAIFLGSISVLLFEMTQIRIFSFSLPPILAYSGISFAMLGFGIGSMLLSLSPRLFDRKSDKMLSWLLLLQAGAMIVSSLVFAKSSWPSVLSLKEGGYLIAFLVMLPCTSPYFFGGMFLGIVFSTTSRYVGKVYFWNLFGSALGAVLITVLISPLGTHNIIAISAIIACIAAVILTLKQSKMLIITSAVIILLSLGYAAAGPSLFPFRPDPTDTIGHILQSDEKNAGPKTKHLFSDWNIVARIDVWNHDDAHLNLPEKVPYKLLTVDAGAATLLIGDPGKENWGDALFKKSLYGAVYWTKPNPQDVLIIGAGGGTDIQTALNNGAQDVTAVEINTTTIGAVTGQFADFLAWPKSNKVNLVHEDGRSYVKSPKKKFDLIQMSGVDTVTVYATGAFNMVEENLYTVEAFQDYLSALKPDGVLGVLRFGSEHLRLAAIASEALMREGITSPEKHIVALRQSRLAGIIVSKKPFDEAMLDQIAAYTSRKKPTKLRMPPFEQYNLKIQSPVKEIYVPGRIISKKFAHYFKKLKSGKAAQKKLFTRLALPTDDTPFFLFTNLLTAPKGNLLAPVENAISLLKRFWVTIIVLAFILILCPVFVLRRKMDSYGPLIWLIPYFFAIGTSFMLIEIGTISAFSIFVGSPGASTAVVLTSILLSSGIGSYLSEFSKREPHIKIVLATIFLVCAALFAKFISPIIFDACWKAGLGQVTRGIVAGLCIAPLGFAMGWFFPSGLKAIARYLGDTRLIPWAFSINGFASVLGSIVALPLSIFYGFTTLFAIGLAGYIATALLTFGFFLKKSPIKV